MPCRSPTRRRPPRRWRATSAPGGCADAPVTTPDLVVVAAPPDVAGRGRRRRAAPRGPRPSSPTSPRSRARCSTTCARRGADLTRYCRVAPDGGPRAVRRGGRPRRPLRRPRLGGRARHDESVAGGRRPRSRRLAAAAGGSRQSIMDPAEHDAAVAVVSHVPQLAASPRRRPAARPRPSRRSPCRDRGCATSPGSRRATPSCGPRSSPATPPPSARCSPHLRDRPRRGHRRPRRAAPTATASAPARCSRGSSPQGNAGHARIPGKHGAAPTAYSDRRGARPRRARRARPAASPTSATPASTSRTCTSSTGSGSRSGWPRSPSARRVAERLGERARATAAGACTAEARPPDRLAAHEQQHLVVAIDGPSGSGKSSVSRAVAAGLGVGYLDTGAMYRALTWWCLEEGVDLDRPRGRRPGRRATSRWRWAPTPTHPSVRVERHATIERRHPHDARQRRSSRRSRPTSTVRPMLQQLQRDLIDRVAEQTGGVVAEGRDITTVVAPDADVRVLLTASEEARLRRRSTELHGARRGQRRRGHPRPDRPARRATTRPSRSSPRPPRASSSSTPPTSTSTRSVEAVLERGPRERRAGLKRCAGDRPAARSSGGLTSTGRDRVAKVRDNGRSAAPYARRVRPPRTTQGTPVSEHLTDDSTVERALRVGLEDFDLSEEDRALLEAVGEDGSTPSRRRAAARRRRRRPPERRQVDPRQPHPRPPRGRRRGRPGRHPRPRRLRRRVDRPPVHPRRHRRLGDRRHGHPPARRRAGRGRRRPRRRRHASSSTPRSAPPTTTRPSSSCCAARASRSSSSPTRSTTSAPRPTPPRCGTSASASRGRSPRCTAGGAATSSTPSSTCCRRVSAIGGAYERGGPRRVALARPPQRRQVLAAQQARRRRAGRRRQRRRHHPRPGRRDHRARRQDLAVRRHRRHPPPRAPDPRRGLLRLAAHPDRAGEGRGRRRPHRRRARPSPSRTSASSSRSSTPAARSSSPTTSGTSLDEERRHYLEREIERELVQIPWAPRVNISARTGRHSREARAGARDARSSRGTPASPTGRLNAFLGEIVAGAPAPGARWQAAAHPLRDAGLDPPAAVRALRVRASSRPATAGSSSAGCARSSASRARRSRSRSGCARSARRNASRHSDGHTDFKRAVCRALRFRSLRAVRAAGFREEQATGCGAAW